MSFVWILESSSTFRKTLNGSTFYRTESVIRRKPEEQQCFPVFYLFLFFFVMENFPADKESGGAWHL